LPDVALTATTYRKLKLFSLDDYRGEIGKMCEWYHRTLAGGTLALNALLMLM
jgi:hypothetical protein